MKFAEYARYDGLGLAALVAGGEVSAAELAQCARQAIADKNPQLNAVLTTLHEQPFAADGPFAGVPFLVKELILQAQGAPSRAGSRALPDLPAATDSSLMARLRRAGLQLVGTTQTPEAGYSATTETLAFGAVHNPWRTGYSAGGSSGGSGAAVAAGLVPLAHANDGGGSIRVPASCNGLVGLKPTRDRTPTGPGASDPLFGHGIEFALTRSVRDCAALLDCVAGPDLGAPHLIAPPPHSYRAAAARDPGRLRIAVHSGSLLGTTLHADNDAAVAATSQRLQALGHELVPCDFHLDFDEFAEHINVLWCAFTAAFVEQVTLALGPGEDTERFEAVTLTCAAFGRQTTALQLIGALDYVNRISRETAAVFEGFDCLMSATLATPPPPHGTLDQNDPALSAIEWTHQTFRYATNTPLFNSTGQPAISLPLHWTADGLPVGVQFAGRMGAEGTLLSLASQLEVDYDWQAQQQRLWQ